ncbi:MAG: lamin tail domain-containing protein, partial [Balneolaceae bacterium]|nr:lamin tail domain-containing protein [Balneolaceae bacterium]
MKTVRVPIADDSEYEQSETAQFRLQNISTGSISEPSQLTLILQDDDTPDIVINEIFADPQDGTGDANGDGSVTARGDQFVEIVNNENETVDISGWTLSDRFGIRFRFPAGTELPAGTATVIFGAGDPSGSFGGARVFTTDDLGIDPTEDELFLKDNQNNIVERVAYAQRAKSGESLTRSDLNGSLSLQHSELPGSRNRLFSPGTKADGTSFGSRYALRLGGGEGWRLLSSPAQNTTFEELLGKFQMTTSGVSNQANRGGTIYEWQSGRFKAVDNIQRNMEAGKGYAIFFYRDDDPGNPGIQGGFPKMISTNAPEHNSPVPVTVSAVESAGSSGWNLMGNPFGTEISVDELLRTLRRALQIERPELQLNGNVYIWDPEANSGNGDYLALEEGVGHKILPFQAFWVRIDNVPEGENLSVSTNLERDELLAETTQRFKEGNREELRMTLSLGDGQRFDDYQLAFNREGEIGLDVQDAFKLHSINTNAISLFSLTGQQRLSKNVLPYDLNATIEIPLDFVADGREALSFEWDGIEEIPDNWNIILTDKELNKEVDLRTAADYRFTVSTNTDQSNMQEESIDDPLHRKISTGKEPRFILAIRP